MANTHPDYWKVKAAVLASQLAQQQAQQAVTHARAQQVKAFEAAGLDPAVNYEFLDADETIVPVP